MPPLFFDEAASLAAHEQWKANCGPHALASACGQTLERIREALLDFHERPWTTPTRIKEALVNLGQDYREDRALRTRLLPARGIARIQWEGRWLKAGVPRRVAYGYTHWVGIREGHVFDTISPAFGWVPLDLWASQTDLFAQDQFEGWHVTHHYHLPSAAPLASAVT
jgi:hypothetical protein